MTSEINRALAETINRVLEETRHWGTMIPEDRVALQEARDLIADPDRWTTHARGRTADDTYTYEDDPRAVKWCAAGAVGLATHADYYMEETQSAYWRIMHSLADKANVLFPELSEYGEKPNIVYVNNFLGHEATIAVMDKVLADERIG